MRQIELLIAFFRRLALPVACFCFCFCSGNHTCLFCIAYCVGCVAFFRFASWWASLNQPLVNQNQNAAPLLTLPISYEHLVPCSVGLALLNRLFQRQCNASRGKAGEGRGGLSGQTTPVPTPPAPPR
jgi:hypothetical protein